MKINIPETENHHDNSKGYNQIIEIINPCNNIIRKLVRKIFSESVDHYQNCRYNIDDGKEQQEFNDTFSDMVGSTKPFLLRKNYIFQINKENKEYKPDNIFDYNRFHVI